MDELVDSLKSPPDAGRGLHSSTFQLNVSVCCEIGGASMGCVGGVWEVFRGYYGGGWGVWGGLGVFCVRNGSG